MIAEHRNEFRSVPWISDVGDHALGERCASDAVNLDVEALSLHRAAGDNCGLGCERRRGKDQTASRRGQPDQCEQDGTHGEPPYLFRWWMSAGSTGGGRRGFKGNFKNFSERRRDCGEIAYFGNFAMSP